MNKIKLELDSLAVESFITSEVTNGANGTVRAHTGNPGVLGTCDPETC